MSILEKYRHYFDIDPDYFPAVNETVINTKPDMWKKFFPHETFVKLLRNTVIPTVEAVKYNGDFDFIVFAQSPNYTPQSADYIIEVIRDYIDEI